MDLTQIRYFLTIAETGSFTRAADRLFISQPSLSVGIKRLEQELGVTLLERGGRRTVLTPAGQSFMERAKAILREYDTALQELSVFDHQPVLRVGTPRTIHIASLSRVIGAFRQQYPQVILELRDGTPQQLITALDEGDLDLTLTAVGGSGSNSLSRQLFQQPLMLAVSTSHPLAERSSVRLSDLNHQPYIERFNCEYWQAYPRFFEAAKVKPHVVYRADREEWVISLIASGLGISIMPVWEGLSEIHYIPIADQSISRTIGLRWRHHQESPMINHFSAFLGSHDWRIAG